MTDLGGPGQRVVALVGSLGTKGAEYEFVRDRFAAAGVPTVLVDTGVLGPPGVRPDVDRTTVARAGDADVEQLAEAGDRGRAVAAMAAGAAAVVDRLHADGRLAAVVVLGGSNAGYTMSQVAAGLPFGLPKVLVSTIVAGDTRPYLGTADLTMFYPVVDLAGLNSVSRSVLARAADAVVGMLAGSPPEQENRSGPVVGCTMFGVTTECVGQVRDALESDGAEVQVFHANGTGGRSFEALAGAGVFDAVADVTTTELADDLLGGVCSAGPDRLTAAGRAGVPQVVSVGALDMANFGPLATVPAAYRGRLLHAHNPSVTLLRTNVEENRVLGALLADRLNAATGPVEVHVPARGFSQISVAGGPFHDPVADAALVEALGSHLEPHVTLTVHDAAVNDPPFATAVVEALHRVLALTPGR